MEFSVVIATKDRARVSRTGARIAAARKRGAPAFEVIVVDNGRPTQTAAVARAYAARRRPGTLPRRARAESRQGAQSRRRGRARPVSALLRRRRRGFRRAGSRAHAAAHAAGEDASSTGRSSTFRRTKCARSRRPRTIRAPFSARATPRCRKRHSSRRADSTRASISTAGRIPSSACGCASRRCAGGLRGTRILWHVKPPEENTLEVESRKAIEKARMARRFLAKHPSRRARLATGAHPLNLLRARYLAARCAARVLRGRCRRANARRRGCARWRARSFSTASTRASSCGRSMRSATGNRALALLRRRRHRRLAGRVARRARAARAICARRRADAAGARAVLERVPDVDEVARRRGGDERALAERLARARV